MRLAMRAGMLLGCIASSCDARAAEATVASICERLALEARVAVCSSDLGAVRALGATVLNPCDDTDGSCEEWGAQGGCESDPHLVLDLCCATCHPTHAEHSGVSQLYLYPSMPVLRPSAGETPPGCRREQAMSLELAGTGSRESCSALHGQPVSTLAPHVHNSSDTAAALVRIIGYSIRSCVLMCVFIVCVRRYIYYTGSSLARHRRRRRRRARLSSEARHVLVCAQ